MRRESSRLRGGVEIIFGSIVAGRGRSLGHWSYLSFAQIGSPLRGFTVSPIRFHKLLLVLTVCPLELLPYP